MWTRCLVAVLVTCAFARSLAHQGAPEVSRERLRADLEAPDLRAARGASQPDLARRRHLIAPAKVLTEAAAADPFGDCQSEDDLVTSLRAVLTFTRH